MQCDAEGQVEDRQHEQRPEALHQDRHQTHLEHIGVEEHQQNNDQVQQDGDVLDYEEHELVGGLVADQFTAGVDEEVEGEQAHLDEEDHAVVAGLELLGPKAWRAPRLLGPLRIHCCSAALDTAHGNTGAQSSPVWNGSGSELL